jgi:hypothetical protein
MQRAPESCTRGEVRSRRHARQFGLAGRNDADDAAYARGYLAADRGYQAPRRSVAGHGCNALTTTAEFFEDAPHSTGSSNPDIHGAVSHEEFWTVVLDSVGERCGLCGQEIPYSSKNTTDRPLRFSRRAMNMPCSTHRSYCRTGLPPVSNARAITVAFASQRSAEHRAP